MVCTRMAIIYPDQNERLKFWLSECFTQQTQVNKATPMINVQLRIEAGRQRGRWAVSLEDKRQVGIMAGELTERQEADELIFILLPGRISNFFNLQYSLQNGP